MSSSSAINDKGTSIVAKIAIIAVFFAVPTIVSAFSLADFLSFQSDKNWVATYATKDEAGVTQHRFATEAACNAARQVAVNQSNEKPPNGAGVTTRCFNLITDTAVTPAEQRTVKEVVEEAQRATSGNPIFGDFSWLLAPLNWIAQIVFYVAGIFLTYMAKIMSWSISVSIDSTMLGNLTFVKTGWAAVRDFANMFFIFGLLYIAIQTILGLAGGNAKRVLAHIIIAALLVNFSLFATKVVIDAGNILAVSIWSKIQTQPGPAQMDGASNVILGGLDLQTLFDEPGNKAALKAMGDGEEMLVRAGGAVFMFIAGYIFLAAALMMITRTVMLLLLMVFSPFAFMSFGLPKMEQYGHKWLDKLLKQTFVAPFFIFMLYLTSVVINSGDLFLMSGSKGQSFLGAFTGSGEYRIIFNFILLISFLVASLSVANSFAGDVGSHARGWAKSATKWAGGLATAGAVGTGAFAMRQTLGKVGMMGKDNKELQEQAKTSAWARGKLALYSGMAKATYDARATKYGAKALSGFGRIDIGQAGGAGGREATGSLLGATPIVDLWNKGDVGTERVKEVLAKADQRYKNNPAGRSAYLEANLGTMFDQKSGKRVNRYLNDTELKATREAISTETRTKAAKDTIKDQPKVIRDGEAEVADLKKRGAGIKLIADAEKGLADATEKLTKAFKDLNGKEFGEMLSEKMLTDNPELVSYMTRQQAAYVNTNSDKYTPKTLELMNEVAMRSGNDDLR
ncbi:MAG: hypothetical protein AAB869_02365, partial [Patescibacteria group bacterium]